MDYQKVQDLLSSLQGQFPRVSSGKRYFPVVVSLGKYVGASRSVKVVFPSGVYFSLTRWTGTQVTPPAWAHFVDTYGESRIFIQWLPEESFRELVVLLYRYHFPYHVSPRKQQVLLSSHSRMRFFRIRKGVIVW